MHNTTNLLYVGNYPQQHHQMSLMLQDHGQFGVYEAPIHMGKNYEWMHLEGDGGTALSYYHWVMHPPSEVSSTVLEACMLILFSILANAMLITSFCIYSPHTTQHCGSGSKVGWCGVLNPQKTCKMTDTQHSKDGDKNNDCGILSLHEATAMSKRTHPQHVSICETANNPLKWTHPQHVSKCETVTNLPGHTRQQHLINRGKVNNVILPETNDLRPPAIQAHIKDQLLPSWEQLLQSKPLVSGDRHKLGAALLDVTHVHIHSLSSSCNQDHHAKTADVMWDLGTLEGTSFKYKPDTSASMHAHPFLDCVNKIHAQQLAGARSVHGDPERDVTLFVNGKVDCFFHRCPTRTSIEYGQVADQHSGTVTSAYTESDLNLNFF